MNTLSRVITLFFLFCCLTSKAQTDIQQDLRVDPLLKQVAARNPHLMIFGRKNKTNSYVNMAVLNVNTKQLKWFTCHGLAFDSLLLDDNEYRQLTNGSLDPFELYQGHCYEGLFYIERAETFFRLQGKPALNDTSHNIRVIFSIPSIQSAKSPLQKLIALEGLMEKICLQLQLFNSRSPALSRKVYRDSARIGHELYGTMIRRADSTEYYNIDPVSNAVRIVLRRGLPGKMFVYDRNGAVMDSLPLKRDKYAAILEEKEDVFLLYRGWLELQWQQATDIRLTYISNLRKLDSSLINPVSSLESKRQAKETLKDLRDQQNAINDKIGKLIVPEQRYVEQLLADAYKSEASEISYLPGLGFAYSLSYTRGQKMYELSDYRGNVMAVASDKKKGIDENNDGIIEYYNADIVNSTDHYPFGMLQPGRTYRSGNSYRYGYNGKENDNEVKGEGNQQDYGMRIYDPRVGRFLSVDPLTKGFPMLTPYQYASNDPILNVDIDGQEGTSGIVIWAMASARSKTGTPTAGDLLEATKFYVKMNLSDAWDGITDWWEHKKDAYLGVGVGLQELATADANPDIHNDYVPKKTADIITNQRKISGLTKIATGTAEMYSDINTLILAVGPTNEAYFIEGAIKSSLTAREYAYAYAADYIKETSKGKLARSVTAIYDVQTGNVYYGMSGELTEATVGSELKKLLPKESLERWSVENCSECAAFQKALKDKANIKDLRMHTVKIDRKTQAVSDFSKCRNCEVTTKDVKTSSNGN